MKFKQINTVYGIKTVLKKIRLRTWIALGLIAILLPIALWVAYHPQSSQAAWFDENWLYRKKLTINDDQIAGSTNLTNYPVLISSTHTELITYAQADGDDIIFVDKDGNKLAHEIESFTSASGVLVAWVKVPTIFPTEDTIIYMYYGNPSATSQQNPQAVWDDGYVGVWHMSQDPSTGAPQMIDSTNKNGDGTSNGTMTDTDQVAAKVNGGLDFDGTNDYISVADDPDLDIANSGTIEVWMKPDAVTTAEGAFSGWTASTDPTGAQSDNGFSENIDMVIVGNKRYYAYLGETIADGTLAMQTAYSDLDNGNFTGWTDQTSPANAVANAGTSIAITSDGVKLYYAALAWDASTQNLKVTTSNLDGTGFAAWTDLTDPAGPAGGGATGQPISIDLTVVGSKVYFAAYTHNSNVIAYETGSVDLDWTDQSAWTAQTNPSALGSSGEATSTAIDSNGEKLYYTAYVSPTNISCDFLVANSALDGSSFSGWTALTDPTCGGGDEESYADMVIAGDKMYFAVLSSTDATEKYETGYSDLDGGNFSGWTDRSAGMTVAAGIGDGTNPAIGTDGKNLYYVAYGYGSSAVRNMDIGVTPITSHPLVAKTDTYELIQSAGGLVLDWAGVPTAFTSAIPTASYTYATVTQDGTNMKFYINGALKRTQTVATDFAASANALELGGDGSTYFDGTADEIRVSSTARSADWTTTTYNNINAPTSFVTSGSEETGPTLAGWWKFDEGADNTCIGGEDACDATTNANDATMTGGTRQVETSCVIGKCMLFDNVDDVATVANATSIDFDTGLKNGVTFETWVNVSSDGEGNVGEIFDKDGGAGTPVTYLRTTNEAAGLVDLEASLALGTANATATVTGGLTIGTWHHVAFGYTDDADDEITVYIDGIARATSTNGSGAPATTDANALLIGGSSGANFHGLMDEVKVYQRERTADEMKVDYVGGTAVLGKSNALAPSADTWYNTSWKYRKLITVDADQVAGAVDFTSFPVVVSITDTDLASYAQADADDILFTDTSGNKLDHEIEDYTAATGVLVAWVRVPTLYAATDTTFWLYFGNPAATNQENETGVWDTNYVMVHHLEEGTTGATDFQDSTTYNHDSSAVTIDGAGSNANAVGKVGSAVQFDGTDDIVAVSDHGDFTGMGVATIELWANFDTTPARFQAPMIQDDSGGQLAFGIYWSNTSTFLNGAFRQGNATLRSVADTTPMSTGSWYHVVATLDGTNVRLYVNGAEVGTPTAWTAGQTVYNSDGAIGVGARTAALYQVDGFVDEVRFSKTNRSADWITTEYNNMNAPGTFLAEGSLESVTLIAPLVHLKFDEGADNTCSVATNDVCNGGSGGLTFDGISTATRTTTAKLNRALDFNGTDSVVTVTNSTGIDLNNNLAADLTFSAWINPDSDGENDNGHVFWKGDATFIKVSGEAGGLVTVDASLDLATTPATVSVTTPIAVGAWSHVAISYTDDADDEITLWINGIARSVSTNGDGAPDTDTNNLLIGNNSAGDRTFDGKIDEFKIYASELTSAQMKVDANYGSTLAYSTGQNEAANLTDGLGVAPVALWQFDENTGTTANDSSGNGKTGTLTTGPTWDKGVYGAGIKFDGTDDFVDVGAGPATVKTVEFWVNPTTTTEYPFDLNGTAYVWINAGTVTAQGFTGPTIYVDGQVTSTVTAGAWQHVVVTTATGLNASDLDIGRIEGVGNHEGYIDQVVLYDYARSASQVAYDYNRGKPAGWWKMDECQGLTANDASGNSYNGTITPGDATGDNDTAGTCGSGTTTEMWNDGSTGKYNASLGFDGTNDYVSIGDTTRTDVYSISFWAKPADTTESFLQLSASDSVAVSSGTVAATGFGTETIYIDGVQTTAFPDNDWHFVTVVSDSAITANVVYLGRVSTTYFSGQLDDIRIYNYALSGTQVKAIMNDDSAARFGPSTGQP